MSQHKHIDHWGGWNPDRPDHRDRLFHLEEPILRDFELAPTGGVPYDESAGPWDQEQEGSCTAHGSLGIFVTEAIRQGLTLPAAPPKGSPLSRQAQYYWTRLGEGTQGQDAGASVRDAIKTLVTVGAVPEADWLYQQSNMFTAPPTKVRTEAKQHLAVKYQSLNPLSGGAPMRTALGRGLEIAFGFPVPTYFEDGSWDPASGQPLPLPGRGTSYIGGHCMRVRAWDFSERFSSGPVGSFRAVPFFTARNNWRNPDGSWWGMNGELNMDYRWFGRLATDLWVIQAVT